MPSARAAASAGAKVLLKLWGQGLRVQNKQRFDYVTDADLASEKAVLATIGRLCPGQAILSEETPADLAQAQAGQGPLWVVDPLDGTTNYIHGFPHVAVSVALLEEGRPAVGVVLDVTKDEEFVAWRGGGAWLNGRRLAVADMPAPEQALFMTGFPFRNKELLDPYLELFRDIFTQSAGVRRAGSAALDLAYVAAGRGQGFWEMGLKPWDMAAGILLVEEAGGLVSDFLGGPEALWRGDIVAAAPGLHGWMQGLCARRFPDITEP
ncbi:MAG: inositol monophosphatase [Proteobacteria bacterium]|nr:inositol monophosphatase [Pseudomonadota bacterium]MBU1450931.1 inositol monophosphatase [Pseudomonadota bacterium]MBU2468222.1 inositol monophosphatase [Pseudomonadota bacterium]MBU2518368.1 inositol monophosphatase [Pseudomonadota bacterium]